MDHPDRTYMFTSEDFNLVDPAGLVMSEWNKFFRAVRQLPEGLLRAERTCSMAREILVRLLALGVPRFVTCIITGTGCITGLADLCEICICRAGFTSSRTVVRIRTPFAPP